MLIEAYSPTIRRKDMDAVLTSMVLEKVGPGEQLQLLINTAKENITFDYCLALRSPAIALFLALQMFELNEGDGVALSVLSPAYYKNVIEQLRLAPVYCDAGEETAVLHPDSVRWAIEHFPESGRVKCLALYHPLGFLPDMEELAALGLPIIEDFSCAYLSGLGDKKAGSFGALSILGLEEHDMLTCGGGALLFAKERRNGNVLRNHANLPPELSLPDMNAAMGVVQFKEAAKNAERRNNIAEHYSKAAAKTRHKLIRRTSGLEYNNYAFPLILETGFKDVLSYAKKKDIVVESAFSNTIIGNGLDEAQKRFPESASLALRTALFPLYPRLMPSSAEKVAKLIQTLP